MAEQIHYDRVLVEEAARESVCNRFEVLSAQPFEVGRGHHRRSTGGRETLDRATEVLIEEAVSQSNDVEAVRKDLCVVLRRELRVASLPCLHVVKVHRATGEPRHQLQSVLQRDERFKLELMATPDRRRATFLGARRFLPLGCASIASSLVPPRKFVPEERGDQRRGRDDDLRPQAVRHMSEYRRARARTLMSAVLPLRANHAPSGRVRMPVVEPSVHAPDPR